MEMLDRVILEKGVRTFPGLLTILNTLCIKYFNIKCTELIFINPESFTQILLKCTGDVATAKLVIKSLFIKPILTLIGNSSNMVDDLTNLLITNPDIFKERIFEIVNRLKTV